MCFPADLVDCIRACITTPSFSLSINGVTAGYFKGKTGLRQGDPMSPLLFAVVMNVLSYMLNRGAEDGIFGYHPGCAEVKLTHLAFADDLLIFLDGSEASLAGVFTVLSQFQKFSGLEVNISKTSMFSSGLPEQSQQNILNRFRLRSLPLPVRYLGLPLCSKKLTVRDCDPLLAQVRRKLNGWMTRHLSIAGRLQLISSTIPGILGFWTSAFCIPKKVLKMIQSLLSSFLWHGNMDSTSAKVAWETLCFPKSEGGLGIRGLSSWNTVFGVKLIWMLYFRAGSIWVAWVRDKYLSSGSFWSLNARNYSISWTFRRLLKLRPIALSFLRIMVRGGGETFFWFDPWTPFGILIDYLGPSGPADLGIPLDALVSSIINGSSWILRPARSDRQVNLQAYLTSFSPSLGCDTAIWKVGDRISVNFSTKAIWNSIRMSKPSVSWSKLIWNQAVIPKYKINTWLFVLNRNPTMDRLLSWGYDLENCCLLCGRSPESRDHLFFICSYSSSVWKAAIGVLGFTNSPLNWEDLLLWLSTITLNQVQLAAVLQIWHGCIYVIWQERNARYHNGLSKSHWLLSREVIEHAKDKSTAMRGSDLGSSLVALWSTF